MVCAALALLSAGVLHRWVHVSRANSASAFSPLASALSDLPEAIGRFRAGQDIPLRSDVLATAAVDSYIQRSYVDSLTGRHIILYVGYWGSENVGLGHGPEICYPAAGWTETRSARRNKLTFDGPQATTNTTFAMHRFYRADVTGIDEITVGFVAVASGEYLPSSRKAFQHRPGSGEPDEARYLAHVHVTSSVIDGAWEDTETIVQTFLQAVLPHLAECFPHSQDRHDSREATELGGNGGHVGTQ